MLSKIFCCGKSSKEEDELKQRNTSENIDLQEKIRNESVARNTKILNQDLYQNYMKPYFKLGYGYKDFMKLFFQKDYYEDALTKVEEDNPRSRNWCERNLIIKNP